MKSFVKMNKIGWNFPQIFSNDLFYRGDVPGNDLWFWVKKY